MSFLVVSIGFALGVAYVGVPWVRETLSPLTDLLVSARPLLVPVLVFLAASTINLKVWVQGIAALLLIPAVFYSVVRPELKRTHDELSDWWHAVETGAVNALRKAAFVAVPLLLVAWAFVKWVLSDDALLGGQGGFPAAAVLLSFVTLLVALGARLFAYATSLARGAVSVALVLATISVLMRLGVLPEPLDAGDAAPWLGLAALAALVVAMVLEQISPPGERDDLDVRTTEEFLGAGLSLALLSGALLVVATSVSMWKLANPDVTPLRADRGAHAVLYTAHDDSVEYRYAPVLAFNRDQKWTPTKVDGYVARATVLRKDGSGAPPGHYTCGSVGPRACLRVTIDCENASKPCAHALPPHDSGDHVSDGAVYVRTLRRPVEADHSDEALAIRGLFRPATKIVRRTHVLLQYWFFYPYDEWTTKVLGARLTQRHEGDWEAVSVGLDAAERPVFVAYSAHCGGTWRRWSDTERFGSHPLVAVAKGSQANYDEAGGKRPPDWTSCKRLPRGLGTLLAFALNVRDVTSDDWQWGAAEVVPVTEKTWPMNFPGTWGGNDLTEFRNLKPHKTKPGGGPASPPLQPLWSDPFKTIFSDRYWDGP